MLDTEGTIRISDLGVSIQMKSYLSDENNKRAGTYNYMSPEMLENGEYSYKTDIWSFGCVVYELLFLEKAFDLDGNNLLSFAKKINDNKANKISEVPKEFKILIEK